MVTMGESKMADPPQPWLRVVQDYTLTPRWLETPPAGGVGWARGEFEKLYQNVKKNSKIPLGY